MIRIGRKTEVIESTIKCNGYEIYIDCSCWTIQKDGVRINTGGLYTLEQMVKYCMEN